MNKRKKSASSLALALLLFASSFRFCLSSLRFSSLLLSYLLRSSLPFCLSSLIFSFFSSLLYSQFFASLPSLLIASSSSLPSTFIAIIRICSLRKETGSGTRDLNCGVIFQRLTKTTNENKSKRT